MQHVFKFVHRLVLATALISAPAAWAGPLVFSAHVEGGSEIVGVVDPTGPVVQIETSATGTSSLGNLRYLSADEVNLGTGVGAGHNRFVADDGSELFGIFTVQLLPTADPAFLELLGDINFTGGTGRFAGADGVAHFTGAGRFVSASRALSSFDFTGEVSLVSEPASAVLVLAGLLGLGLSWRSRGTARTG